MKEIVLYEDEDEKEVARIDSTQTKFVLLEKDTIGKFHEVATYTAMNEDIKKINQAIEAGE
jgi:hypothetical protein